MHARKCTVFPFHPLDNTEERKVGIMLWVPNSINELMRIAAEQLGVVKDSCYLLTEDGGKILDVDLIDDGQKLYLIGETQ